MDSDRIKGKAKDLMGQGKEGVGNVTHDSDLQAEGKGDQAEGNVQEKFGKAKDTVRNVVDDIKK